MKKALLISCFNWYETRLEPVREILINHGYKVTVLIADFDHFKKKPVDVKYPECTYIKVPHYARNISLRRIHSHMKFGRTVAKWLEKISPELIYLQVPPNNIAEHCRKYKRKHPETKLIMDIIDLWPESMPIDRIRNTLPAKAWKNWRDDCIDVADHIFTECELYQEKMNLNKSKTSTLYLFKRQTAEERDLVEAIIRNGIPKDNKIRFAYLGSMNNIIDIDGICEVIGRFIKEGYDCELHAVGGGEARDAFEKAVRKTGCKTCFYGPIFDETEKIKILAPCDYALNMMKDNITVGLTIKSIDYLSYGLPLINNLKGDTWQIIEHNDIGSNISNVNLHLKNMSEKRTEVLRIFDSNFNISSFKEKIENALNGLYE